MALVRHHGPRPPQRQIGGPTAPPTTLPTGAAMPTLSRCKRRHDDAPTRRRRDHRSTKPAPIEPERHHALWSIDSKVCVGPKAPKTQRTTTRTETTTTTPSTCNNRRRDVAGAPNAPGLPFIRSNGKYSEPESPTLSGFAISTTRPRRPPQRDNPSITPAPIEPERHHALWSIDSRYVWGLKP